MLFLLLILLLTSRALAQCESECNPLSSLLSKCALPPLTTNRTTDDPPRGDYRNLTGIEFQSGPRLLPGPYTTFLATAADAECLCIDGVHSLPECSHCLSMHRFEKSLPMFQDDERTMDTYEADCTAWGYFANETLEYPTTTRSALPSSETGYIDIGDSSARSTCGTICGVIRSQINDCGLAPLEGETEDEDEDEGNVLPPRTRVDPRYSANLLLNRTAGECMCSLPVLRRSRGCWMCIDAEREVGRSDIVQHYLEECNKLGYWSDSAVVEPAEELEEGEGMGPGMKEAPTDSAGKVSYISPGSFALSFGLLLVVLSGYLAS